MHARSHSFRVEPSSVQEAVAFVRDEVLPQVTALEGSTGLSMLADRESGRCIVTSAWQSREALRASEPRLAGLRDRAAAVFGTRPETAEWEVAVMHRRIEAPATACTRVTWLQAAPGQADRVVDAFRLGALPRLDELLGFCSASLLVDRTTGRCAAAVTYMDRAALEASREAGGALRTAVARDADGDVLDVAEFELVVAHLRVPEMA